MAPIAFKGFTSGSRVTIGGVTADAWGLVAGGDMVWDKVSSPGVSVRINVTRSAHRVAPEGVFFHPTVSGFDTNTAASIEEYDPSYHDKVYFWDYGESYTYAAPTQVIAMDAADGGKRTDSRYSRGPLGAHVFRTPGPHVVRLAVLEPSSGKWGQAVEQFNVADPKDFYEGPTTLFVDSLGNHANAPQGAQRFTSLTSAFAVLSAATTPHRIVLERGQTHTIDSTLEFRPPSNASGVSLRIEAREGTGPRPVIAALPGFSGTDILLDRSLFVASGIDTGSIVKGVRLQGTWDSTTETGNWDLSGINWSQAGARNCIADDCELSNLNTGIRTFSDGTNIRNDRVYIANDTIISDWSNYGYFDPDQGLTAILGSRFAQNVDAIGGGPKDGAHNNHGPARIGLPNRVCILSSDFFSCNGWSIVANSHRAIQPGLRINTNAPYPGVQVNIQSCAIETGSVPIVMSAANNTSRSRLMNALVEGNILLGGFQSTKLVNLSHGGVTVRNNLFIYPRTNYDTTRIPAPYAGQSRGPGTFIDTATNGDGDGTDAANLAAPIQIYNNTLVNLSNVRRAIVFSDDIMQFATTLVENNVVHEPDPAVSNPYPRLSATPAFTPRLKGYRPVAATLYPEYASAPDSVSIWVPQPADATSLASPALGNAMREPNASADFRGELRPEPPSMGAFEAD